MRLLIYSSNQVGANYLLMHCLAYGDLEASTCSQPGQLMELLQDKRPADILILEQDETTPAVFEFLRATKAPVSIFLIGSSHDEVKQKYPDLKLVSELTFDESRQSLFDKLTLVLEKTEAKAKGRATAVCQPSCSRTCRP